MIFKRVAVCCLGLVALQAQAWGPDGHRIVARIAEDRLTEPARLAVATLLNPDERLSDDSVASWADYVRKKKKETGPWHFVDIPFEAAGFQADRDCPAGEGCIVDAILRDQVTLASARERRGSRSAALRFLVHFLGDIHQPLHCINRDEDRGGNLRIVRYPGMPEDTNLHVTWDVHLVRALLGERDPIAYADELNARITPELEQRWARGGPEDWANESHAAAVRFAYAGVPHRGGAAFPLSADYVKRNLPVLDRQFMAAGVRLARLLNDAFAGPPVAP